jgi:hypothetical protein
LEQYLKKLVVLTNKKLAERRADPGKEVYTSDNIVSKQAGVKKVVKKLEVLPLSPIPDTSAYATLRYARHQNQMVGPRVRKINEEKTKKKR